MADFLLEAKCEKGHASSLACRGFTAEQAEDFRRMLSSYACAWAEGGDPPCGAATSLEVFALEARDTLPSEGMAVEVLERRTPTIAPLRPIPLEGIDGPITGGE